MSSVVTLLVCSDGGYGRRIRDVLEAKGVHVSIAGSSADCDRHLHPDAIVVAANSANRSVIKAAFSVRVNYPVCPLVAIVVRDADFVRELVPLRPDDIIWCGSEQELVALPTLRGVTSMTNLFAQDVAREPHLSDELRWFLLRILQSDPPLRSVIQVAAALGCHRTSLDRRWRRICPTPQAVRLEDFLRWSLIAAALSKRHGSRSWQQVAADIGTTARTLGKLSRRYTGLTLSRLSDLPASEVRSLFRNFLYEVRVAGLPVKSLRSSPGGG